jgi:hypothetical protein
VLHHQKPQDDLHRRGRPTGLGRAWPTPTQIGLDALEQLVVVEEPVQFGQFRFKAQLERWYQREQIDGCGPIS